MKILDISVMRISDGSGEVSYQLNTTTAQNNHYKIVAERFIKHLLSSSQGNLVGEVKTNRNNADIYGCVERTHQAMLEYSRSGDNVYSLYSKYKIKSLDINRATSSIKLEIQIMFTTGNTIMITL